MILENTNDRIGIYILVDFDLAKSKQSAIWIFWL